MVLAMVAAESRLPRLLLRCRNQYNPTPPRLASLPPLPITLNLCCLSRSSSIPMLRFNVIFEAPSSIINEKCYLSICEKSQNKCCGLSFYHFIAGVFHRKCREVIYPFSAARVHRFKLKLPS